TVLVAIDKLDKIGMDGVRAELLGRGLDEAAVDKLLHMLESAPQTVEETLNWLSDELEGSENGSRGVAELKQVVLYAAHGPAQDHLAVDPYLARGLSYYTGAIFEIEFIGLNGSGGGGGRYDNLVGMFSNQTIPACGFSLGLERILLIMEERGLFPDHVIGRPQVMVTQFDDSTVAASLQMAKRLRAAGLRVDLYPDLDRYGRQFKYADERQIRYAVILGPDEVRDGLVSIKDLGSGEQSTLPQEDIVPWLQQRAQ
ncbi:MAG: ATP phosphoribosyltransferase regulatory subunit, partial [Caldilineaceae bacterium]|nr:ATP phosphoribosyltransferase regulatory subunit [Caldilineaceae bacterium]